MTGFRKTKYPGVKYRTKTNSAGKQERVYYITYRTRKPGGGWKQHNEVAGYQYRDAMTPAKASIIRGRRMQGGELPNRERRQVAKAARLEKTWTVSALWQGYRKANPDLRDNGTMTANYKRYIEPRFGDREPRDILALDIDRLKRRDLRDKAPQTVVHVLELLRRLVNFGVKRGLCPGMGFVIRMPKLDNVTTEDLTPEQMKKLLEVIDRNIKYQTPSRSAAHAMRLVLLTGLRRGELFRLKWENINWRKRNITLQQTKSGRTQVIPMSSHTELLLREIQDREGGRSELVFPGLRGGQRKSMKSANTIKAEAELPPDFRPLHGLRHVFGTNLANRGVDRDIIARLMTHARDRSVTSRYVHYREDTLRQAAELAGELIEQAARSGGDVVELKG